MSDPVARGQALANDVLDRLNRSDGPTVIPTERECETTIIAAAMMLGYRVHAERPAQSQRGWRTPIRGHAGFPDLVIAGHGRIWFVELKRRPRKPDPAQIEWIEALNVCGDVQSVVLYVPEQQQDFIDELVAARAARVAS